MAMSVAEMKAPALEVSEKIMKEVAAQAVEAKESASKKETKDRIAVVMTKEREDLAIQDQIPVAKADHLQVVPSEVEKIDLTMATKDRIAVAMTKEQEDLAIQDQILVAKADHLRAVRSAVEKTDLTMATKGQQELSATDQIQEETTIAQKDFASLTTIEEANVHTVVEVDSANAMAIAVLLAMKEEVEADLTAEALANVKPTIAQVIEAVHQATTGRMEEVLKNVMASVQVERDQTTLVKEGLPTAAQVREGVHSTAEIMTIDVSHAAIANQPMAPNALTASRIISQANAPALVDLLEKAEPFRQIMIQEISRNIRIQI